MYKNKKIKTVTVEKYTYDNDDKHEIELYPELLLKLLWHARAETTADEQLQRMVDRMRLMMLDKDCLDMEDYESIVTDPTPMMSLPLVEASPAPVTAV